MGSSMAENHPVGFQWVVKARERGAVVIHVDPRFTRTSAMADIWVPLRAGTDILFLGGLIRYALENDKYFREYVEHYTNAPTIIRENFRDTEDLGGIFSGWDEAKKKYSPESWLYQGAPDKNSGNDQPGHSAAAGGHGKDRGGEAAQMDEYEADPTLQHPRCVFQILRRHFARYTPELIEQHAGVPKDLFLKVAETFCNASGPEKTAAICYAVGWTQHSKGVQIIRSAAILQLLLGNIGRPGGGILALRGHASIQGSTDIPTLYDILPGYLPMTFFEQDADSYDQYIERHTGSARALVKLRKLLREFDESLVRRLVPPKQTTGALTCFLALRETTHISDIGSICRMERWKVSSSWGRIRPLVLPMPVCSALQCRS